MLKPAYIDLPETAKYIALSESTVQNLVRKSEFPKPRLLSGRRVAWLVREVDAWAEDRPVAELLPPANSGCGKGGKSVTQLT